MSLGRRLLPSVSLGAFASALACAGVAAVPAHPTLVLRPQAEAVSARVRLGDVAEIEGLAGDERARAEAVVVATAPRAGGVLVLDRGRVLAQLPAGWQARGAAAVRLTRAVRALDGSALCAAELAALEPRLAALPTGVVHAVECAVDGTVVVPAGATTPRPDAAGVRLIEGPQRASLALVDDEGAATEVALTLRLSLQAAQWCAREAIAQAQAVLPGRFDACRVPVRHERQLAAAGTPLPSGRLRRALHAGEVLSPVDVVDADAGLAGDAVTVRFLSGGLSIEAGGRLVQDARVGDAVKVQIGSAGAPVTGRLAGAGLVQLEDQP